MNCLNTQNEANELRSHCKLTGECMPKLIGPTRRRFESNLIAKESTRASSPRAVMRVVQALKQHASLCLHQSSDVAFGLEVRRVPIAVQLA